jgi:formylglycine-generating enzyme required for sulfatase activity
VPQAAPAPELKPPPPVVDPSGQQLPSECTRGTGRNGKGECVKLATRILPHGQQVQMPEGFFVMGDIPLAYDTSPTRQTGGVQWPGQPPRDGETKSFWFDLHEVTRESYEKCVADGKCTAPVCDTPELSERFEANVLPALPQTCVTHEQAEAFCKAQDARLPTALEWEYAARGVDGRMYPWGNEMRDEFAGGLAPRVSPALDSSYFGIRALGSSALEWVADAFDPEAALRPFVEGEFRRKDGPLRTAMAKADPAFTVKSSRVGHLQASSKADPQLGFRCAADLGPEVEVLRVPAKRLPIPIVRPVGALVLFGGVVESVDHEEAAAFCKQLKVDAQDRTWTEWRLPTLAEVQAIADSYRGPGPFWAADGAAIQRPVGERPEPTDPWVTKEAEPSEPLAARCVHDGTPPT